MRYQDKMISRSRCNAPPLKLDTSVRQDQGLHTGGNMGRKPRVDRSPEEKWQIVQEGIKSGNVSETCRRHGIALNLFYRWKDEAEQGAKAALGRKSLEIEILKNVVGE